MKREIGYRANDGTRFATANECKRHEHNRSIELLVKLTDEQVKAALDRSDVTLANAIELAGNIIAEKRRADGGVKRRKRKTDAEKLAEGATTIAATQEKKKASK